MATKPEEQQQDEEELVVVETPSEDDGDAGQQDDASANDDDERLSGKEQVDADDEGDDESDGKPDSFARKRRRDKRERERRAKERSRLENEFLRQQLAEMQQRINAVEGIALAGNEQSLDQRIAQAEQEMRTAEQVMAKAMEVGNGEDFARAMSFRDEARDAMRGLQQVKQQAATFREQASQPRPDPAVEHYRKQWLADNSDWFGKPGYEEDTTIARAVDAAVMRDGYNPGAEDYWREMNRRLEARLNPSDEPVAPRRRVPPQGLAREHAPPATRQREVVVTPDRKQAMIDAGIWDDPVKRNQMLKAYAEYDRENQTSR